MKKHFILIIIFILFFPIVLLQNNFSKTNPYDPNWIYWDDTLFMDKSFYKAPGDKWAYITYLNYLWTLRYNENVQGRDEQFLVKQETLDFVRNMILAADGDRFKSFFQSISSLVLHNEDVTLAIRKEYSDLVIDTLKQKNIQDEDSTKAQQYKKTFAKEFGVKENLKSPTFNYVLEYLSGRMPLYHFDVYRLCNSEEIYEIGYEDYINNGGVALIEWANIILEDLPKEYIRIEFKYTTKEDERLVDIRYIGNKEKEAKFNVDFGNWYFN